MSMIAMNGRFRGSQVKASCFTMLCLFQKSPRVWPHAYFDAISWPQGFQFLSSRTKANVTVIIRITGSETYAVRMILNANTNGGARGVAKPAETNFPLWSCKLRRIP